MSAPLLLSLMLIPSPHADTIRVGDPSVVTALPVGVDTIDAYIVQSGQRRLTVTSVQAVAEVPEGFLVVQENKSASGETLSLDSIVVAARTLATAWHGDVTLDGRRHVEFSSGRMTGVRVDSAGHDTWIDTPVSDQLFDYSILTLVVDHLPLSVGYRATVGLYDITRGPVYVTIRVLAAESVSLGGSAFDAWRMEVHLGQQIVTRWVERSTGRELKWSVEMGGREMTGERRTN